jgi:outer membrane protein assembly factor BamB
MSANETNNNAGYQLATRVAAIAAVVAIVVCALLFYDYARRLAKDPLDSPVYKTLLAALEQQPRNETLKEQVRELDLELRGEYFRQRAFADVGAGLLLVAVIVFLLAMRTALTLRRQMPSPTAPSGSQDREAAWTRIARWAVAVLSVAMVAAAMMLAFSARSPLQDGSEEPASVLDSPQNVAATNNASALQGAGTKRLHPEAPTTVEMPASDAEVAKMWPRFRGPGGLGISAYTNVPDVWDAASGKTSSGKRPCRCPATTRRSSGASVRFSPAPIRLGARSSALMPTAESSSGGRRRRARRKAPRSRPR